MSIVTVHTCSDRHGDWEVELAERGTCATCQTIYEARCVALELAAREQPCEVIVRDAYDRVLERALIDDRADG